MNSSDRKKHLIAQGAIYRAEVTLAKASLRESLRPQSLARSALSRFAGVAVSALRGQSGASLSGLELQAVLPLVLSVLPVLTKRKPPLKIVLSGAAVVAVAAGVVTLFSRRGKTSPEPDQKHSQPR